MFVHGNNLEQKENHQTKYRDAESRRYLVEIRARYNQWKAANEALVGPVSVAGANDAAIIARRVELLNDYKEFLVLTADWEGGISHGLERGFLM